MVGGFVCARCDQLYEDRPGSCHECGHEGMQTLTFSEFRQRRRAGGEPWSESDGGHGGLRTTAMVVLAVGLVVVGLAAIGMGTMAMGVTVPF
ncbi:hypothetical protein [Haloglomus litoreum]|uniref:hypothetical protein n=1 Tax=Haloglomus litoreum TaxID=3034026 RepID=UPI0023E8769D|nr:hypothetical protein [Haloglomus sp. DT116]